MSYAKAGIFFFICWLVQTTLLWRVWPFGVAPNLLLCAVVCFAWLYDENYSLVYAAIFGLLLDVQLHALFGVQALAFVLCCIPAFLLRRVFNPERTMPLVLAALIATPLNDVVLWWIYSIFGSPVSLLYMLHTLPERLIAHAAICFALHILLVRTIIKHRKDRRYIGGTA
ncbi:MAG: rod shape-determining protein MreD [Clostridiales bacterium]|nr:rod shape-determining protein MreD [Clostridiales bacterium]